MFIAIVKLDRTLFRYLWPIWVVCHVPMYFVVIQSESHHQHILNYNLVNGYQAQVSTSLTVLIATTPRLLLT